MPSNPFTLGVLLFPPVQLLDLSPTDLFGMLTRSYLEACNLPAPLLALGIDVEIHYITSSHVDGSSTTSNTNTNGGDVGRPGGAGNAVPLTANMHILSTTNTNNPKVQPGLLSALLIPGPEPKYIPTAAEIAFMQSHANSGTDVLTVCTGVFAAGHAGILDGRKVTGPRGLVGKLRGMFPKATWRERRWERDLLGGDQKRSEDEAVGREEDKGERDANIKTNTNGEYHPGVHAVARPSTASANDASKGQLWTSGGITNGLDMVAAYLHHKARSTPKSTSTSTTTTTSSSSSSSNRNPSLKASSSSNRTSKSEAIPQPSSSSPSPSSPTAQTASTKKTPPNPATQTQLPSPELIDLICRLADIPQRSQDYDVSKIREVGWWMWLIGRSWVKGLMRRA